MRTKFSTGNLEVKGEMWGERSELHLLLIRTETQEKEHWQGLTFDLEVLGLERGETLVNIRPILSVFQGIPGRLTTNVGTLPMRQGRAALRGPLLSSGCLSVNKLFSKMHFLMIFS